MMFHLWEIFWLKNYVAVDTVSDVVAEATDFVVPTKDEIPVWDDVVIA